MAVCIISFVVGIIALSLSFTDVTALTYISQAFNGIPNTPGVSTLNSNLMQFVTFIPDLAALMVIVLICECFILSFFVKAHPLGAIGGLLLLVGFTIVSFYLSNATVQIAKLSIFNGVIANAGPLLFIWINMPVILIICSVIDLGISITAAKS